MKPELMPFMFMVVSLYMAYAIQVRNGRIDGRAIFVAGGAMWLLGLGITSAMIWPSIAKEGFRLIAVNATTMTLLTAWCVYMAWRSAQIKEELTLVVGETQVVLQTCSPWRIRGVEALVLPNTTALRSITGPAATVQMAAGKGLEKDTRAASPVKLDKVLATGGGALSVPKIFHVAVNEPSKPVDPVRLRRGIEAAVVQARKAGIKQLGIPVSALRGLSPLDTATVLVEGALHQKKAFEKLVFIALDARDVSLIRAVLEKVAAGS